MAKAWDKGQERRPGDRVQIHGNLDCRPLNEAVYQTHKPIPTVEELRHIKSKETVQILDTEGLVEVQMVGNVKQPNILGVPQASAPSL